MILDIEYFNSLLPKSNTKVACKCDNCGKEQMIYRYNIKNASYKYCQRCRYTGRDMRKINLCGRKFGKITVLEYVGSVRTGNQWKQVYKCKCDCGTVKNISSGSLTSGNTNTCGLCSRKRLLSGESALRRTFRHYKRNARNKNRIFNLTIDQFMEITSMDCYYCDSHPSNVTSGLDGRKQHIDYGSYTYNGIDRVDNSDGYVVGNVVACCSTCNIAKNDMSVSDFLKWVSDVNLTTIKKRLSVA